jgi:hypothetical protein
LGVIKSDILVEPLDPVNEGDTVRYTRTLGHKYFELSNHLGNVLATVSDQKISVDDNGSVDYYLPKVVSYSDYYPFGMQMEGRSGGTDYRFGFNGKLDGQRHGLNGIGSTIGEFVSKAMGKGRKESYNISVGPLSEPQFPEE